jgi:hypothetical protein
MTSIMSRCCEYCHPALFLLRNLAMNHWIALLPPLLALSSSALAGVPPFTKETCHYEGNTTYNGHLTIETRYERTPERTVFRTLLRFSARFLIWGLKYDIDEIDQLSPFDGSLTSVGLNARYVLNGTIKRQQWDDYAFNWLTDSTSAERIQGGASDEFAQRYPKFAEHWDYSHFGDDWLDDYEGASPDTRSDLDIKGFSNQIASTLYVAFLSSRFADPTLGPVAFEPFIPGSKTGKPADPLRADPLVQGDQAIWRVPLSIDGLATPDGKPAEFRVDEATHTLQAVHLTIKSPLGSAEGDIKLIGCQNEWSFVFY